MEKYFIWKNYPQKKVENAGNHSQMAVWYQLFSGEGIIMKFRQIALKEYLFSDSLT